MNSFKIFIIIFNVIKTDCNFDRNEINLIQELLAKKSLDLV